VIFLERLHPNITLMWGGKKERMHMWSGVGFAISQWSMEKQWIGLHVWSARFHISKRLKITHCIIIRSIKKNLRKPDSCKSWIYWNKHLKCCTRPLRTAVLAANLWFVYVLSERKLMQGQKKHMHRPQITLQP